MDNHMKNILLIAVLFTTFSASCYAQENFDFTRNQLEVWKLAKERTLDVARQMPEERYNYKPVKDVKSFGQQMTHMSNSLLSMYTRFILEENYGGREKDAALMTKAEIITELEGAFQTIIEGMANLSDADVKTTGKKHGAFPLSKWQSLLFMRDHITNHRAKAVLYLRLNHIAPPSYGFN
jgi:uncharacterized damage-inducible protein DinB